MPIEIDSFTTDVSLVDRETALSPRQLEQIVEEVLRRLERRQREQQRAAQNSSYDQLARRH